MVRSHGWERATDEDAGTSARGERIMTPTIFVAHGSPLLLDDAEWVFRLQAWSRSMPAPSSILIVSAHWVQNPIAVGATQPLPLVYDFSGFARRYFEMTYATPDATVISRMPGRR